MSQPVERYQGQFKPATVPVVNRDYLRWAKLVIAAASKVDGRAFFNDLPK
jgi:hypothetical protein